MKQVGQMERKHVNEMQPFLYPVGELLRQVEGYSRVVRKPIDLLIIKNRIAESEYETPQQIDSDMKLMFKNAILFNPPDHEVHVHAKNMMAVWNERFKGLPPKEVPRGLSEDIGVDEMIEEAVEDNFESGTFMSSRSDFGLARGPSGRSLVVQGVG
jgi:bromodomain-containing factor 1